MRIFYASGKRPNGALEDSNIWHENLYGSLVDLGHDVVEFDYDLEPLLAAADYTVPANVEFVDEHRPRAERELLRQLRAAHAEQPLDLFFSYFYSSCCTAQTIHAIRDMGIPTMNWYCNASYQLHLVADIAPAYDWCLVPEAFRLDDYRELGANPVYFQEAANPLVYHPFDVPRDYDVTFVGARYADRPNHVRDLLDAGIDVHAWGPGWLDPAGVRQVESFSDVLRVATHPATWRRLAARGYRRMRGPEYVQPILPRSAVGGPLSDDEMIRMYSRSNISLGFSGVAQSPTDRERITQIRLRDFEAPMSGAFYLVEYQPDLEEYFVIGKEIACYEGREDLVDKCRYYVAHPDEREAIRAAGHERALRDHTWQQRFRTLFESLGL